MPAEQYEEHTKENARLVKIDARSYIKTRSGVYIMRGNDARQSIKHVARDLRTMKPVRSIR